MSSLLVVASDRPNISDHTPESLASPERLPFDFDAMLSSIRREFFEMPGLRLTEAQVRRLWSLDQHTCAVLLAVLVDAKLLTWRTDGRVMKAE